MILTNKDSSVEVTRLLNIPTSMITNELEGMYGSAVLRDMYQIIQLYGIYDHGVQFPLENNKDYTPADLRYKMTRALIDKEARFLFSKSPDLFVDVDLGDSKEDRKRAKDAATVYQTLVDTVLRENNFKPSLVQAAKDCFIGKRVALMFNVNTEEGMQISFLPSLEFVYDVDPRDYNKLTKIVAFYGINDEKSKQDQRLYKKKYWLEDGVCWYSEEIYDGLGNLIETLSPPTATLFEFIPACVVVNDGLTGDLIGTSEIELLSEYESWYSKLAAADMDAERKGMNPIRYTVDASPESTKDLSISAGAFWDIASDQNQSVDRSAQVGVLDSPMSYSGALSTTLDRIKGMIHEQCSVPNVSPDALRGVVSSGKTLKAIYWDLIVRCDDKMLVWRPALELMVRCIIEGARLYPEAGTRYIEDQLPDVEYTVRVDNQYPLPEDESEEKQVDLAEVTAQTMSKKAYMKKWRQLTDEEADEELRQIALERQILEDSFAELSENPEEDTLQEQEQDTEKEEEEDTLIEDDEEVED